MNNILLKTLIHEIETNGGIPLRVQCYVDMDGVLVDMDKGFAKISGGYTTDNYKEKFGGNKQAAQKSFWKLINQTPNFWLNLDPTPDAKVLWDFLRDNFTDPVPVILSAGQGTNLIQQKTAWIRKHIDPSVKVIISSAGVRKSEHLVKFAPNERVTHLLIDDTQRNIDAWDNVSLHRVAIYHTDAANTIKQLQSFLSNQQ